MANIGTTITPWQIFFQQSAVVDKGMDIRDIYDAFKPLERAGGDANVNAPPQMRVRPKRRIA